MSPGAGGQDRFHTHPVSPPDGAPEHLRHRPRRHRPPPSEEPLIRPPDRRDHPGPGPGYRGRNLRQKGIAGNGVTCSASGGKLLQNCKIMVILRSLNAYAYAYNYLFTISKIRICHSLPEREVLSCTTKTF